MAAAILAEQVVFPSRGPELVTRMTWGAASAEEKRRLVRIPR